MKKKGFKQLELMHNFKLQKKFIMVKLEKGNNVLITDTIERK